jgi:hypothetical protein
MVRVRASAMQSIFGVKDSEWAGYGRGSNASISRTRS